MKKLSILLSVWLSCFLFVTPSWSSNAAVGEKIPSFSVKTLAGDTVSTQSLEGDKPLLLVFWATWCPTCLKEVPSINKFYKQYQKKGLQILSINAGRNDSVDRVKRYIKKYDVQYPVFFDQGSKISGGQFQLRGVPYVVVANKAGIVEYQGFGIPHDLEEKLPTLLN